MEGHDKIFPAICAGHVPPVLNTFRCPKCMLVDLSVFVAFTPSKIDERFLSNNFFRILLCYYANTTDHSAEHDYC